VVITESHLLAGRISYRQPAVGFRTGIEPVLLAASVPIRRNERVLEAGTGAGAALLCLAARCDGLSATGVEIDPLLARIAAENAAVNQFPGIEIVCGPIEHVDLAGPYDHAISNPPYHDPHGTTSPISARERAKRGSVDMLNGWIARIAGLLRHRGTMTLILPSWLISAALTAMHQAACPCTTLLPLWPKQGKPAKLVLLRGIRDARAPMQLLSGLVLHQDSGAYTTAARAILEDGLTTPLASQSSPAVG
jgi:tRNA1Val (adenine37-N6)-methyltransferase